MGYPVFLFKTMSKIIDIGFSRQFQKDMRIAEIHRHIAQMRAASAVVDRMQEIEITEAVVKTNGGEVVHLYAIPTRPDIEGICVSDADIASGAITPQQVGNAFLEMLYNAPVKPLN